jgi:hypothetical protein
LVLAFNLAGQLFPRRISLLHAAGVSNVLCRDHFASVNHDPPVILGNMRELGVQRLIAYCLNDACRHTALIDVSSYPAETEVPSFGRRAVCGKCRSRGNKIDVRPNWKEQPPRESLTGKVWR